MVMDIHFLLSLKSTDVVLTPNQRLANTLQKALEQYHDSLNNHAFMPPIFLSMSQFIRLLWKSYIFISPKKLLTNDEEAWLWRNIIAQSSVSKNLLNPHQAASLVRNAWHHLAQWTFNIDDINDYIENNENTTFFTTWAKIFNTMCSQRSFIDESKALEAYVNTPDFLQNLVYENIYFYHFIELTPLQKHFITTLKQQDKHVIIVEQDSINHRLARAELPSAMEEISAMAAWAKQHYTDNQRAHIACVIPDLHQKREEVLRHFKTAFNTEAPPIDISAGYLLSEFTMVQHVLLLMTLLEPTFDYELFSTYLRSAYFGLSETDMSLRHQCDVVLRKKCSKTTSLQQIFELLTETQHEEAIPCACPEKGEHKTHPYIAALAMKNQSKSQRLSTWCHDWLDFLKQLGWPGQRNLNSTEYQVAQRFIKLLEDLEDFSSLQTDWTWQEFAFLLKTQCQNIIFQPEKEKTAIQILGLLEASGMTFDHLWVMGLDDKTWPSTPSPNPFLPYALQKKYGFPHASAEREYEFCKNLQQQLIASSTSVIFSSAKQDEDKALNPSPLIAKITEHTITSNEVSPQRRLEPSLLLEKFIDNIAPSVSENEKISGGTSIVQQQALCPFKAFSNSRLHAHEMPEPIDVPNALIRGNRIHRALELFWKEVKTSENLLVLSEKNLDMQIKKAINRTYAEQNNQDTFFTELEKIRLNKLMYAWLELEKKRPAFSVIAVEQTREYHYKNMTLRIRIDRVDELENGEQVIIDYKTGSPNIHHWLGSRLKEPQLPIYCVSHPTMVSAMLFAQLRWNDLTIKGMADGDCDISTVTAFEKLSAEMRAPTWQQQKIQWKNSIDQLLEDFLNGKAEVDPLDQTTCNYCHLQALCRIFEHE
jgi:probable DNA repair protein